MLIKEKRPQSMFFTRNEDGTYEVLYQGVAIIDDNNNIKIAEIRMKRCILDWDDTLFLPQPKVKEILPEKDTKNLVDIIYNIE